MKIVYADIMRTGGNKMSGLPMLSLGWFRQPEVKAEDGYLLSGQPRHNDFYYPVDYVLEILTAIQVVSDEKTALDFARNWGLLGLANAVDNSSEKWSMLHGAEDFYCNLLMRENPGMPLKEACFKARFEVRKYFGFYNDSDKGLNLTPKGDKISDVIYFTQEIKHISKVKQLLKLFQEDNLAADYDSEEWFNNLPGEWLEILTGFQSLKILKDDYSREIGYGWDLPCFNQWLLEKILAGQRFKEYNRYKRGVWVELYRGPAVEREGKPVIKFDGLFRFIKYVLLVEQPSYWPKKCADPKCRSLFFPTKADQEYCPHPQGKRSRCENRHGRELRRNGKGKKIKGAKLN